MTVNEIIIALFWIVTASYVVYLGWSLYSVVRRAISPAKASAHSSERVS